MELFQIPSDRDHPLRICINPHWITDPPLAPQFHLSGEIEINGRAMAETWLIHTDYLHPDR